MPRSSSTISTWSVFSINGSILPTIDAHPVHVDQRTVHGVRHFRCKSARQEGENRHEPSHASSTTSTTDRLAPLATLASSVYGSMPSRQPMLARQSCGSLRVWWNG